MTTAALIAGGLIIFTIGFIVGGLVVGWVAKGVIDDQADVIDAWEATRWGSLERPQ